MIRISGLAFILILSSNIIVISSVLFCSTFAKALSIPHNNLKDESANNILNFSKPINLSNNNRDSIYSQIAVSGKDVYVVWEQLVNVSRNNNTGVNSNVSTNDTANVLNYDVYMKKSTDGGRSFSREVNVSNNSGFSEHPQIAVYGRNVYIIWADSIPNNSYYNKEILYRKSTDGGRSFSNVISLLHSRNCDSSNQDIAAYGNNVYVVWKQKQQQYTHGNSSNRLYLIQSSSSSNTLNNNDFCSNNNNTRVLFRASTDGGSTFKETKMLSNNATELSYPKIAAPSDKDVYIVWNIGIPVQDTNKRNEGIFFVKSIDNGESFSAIEKVSDKIESIGDPQIAAYGSDVYIAWSGIPEYRITGDIFFTKSSDKGNSFTPPVSLNTKDSLNIEMAAHGDNVYVLWPSLLSEQNDDIFIKSSINRGIDFTESAKNISNSIGISECPSLGLSSDGNSTYLVWEDTITHGLHQIFFTKNTGTT